MSKIFTGDSYKSPKWQKKRLEILERDEYTCQHCADTETSLHVHHTGYSWATYGVLEEIDGKQVENHYPWSYPNEMLITLCETCHKKEHDLWRRYPHLYQDVTQGNEYHYCAWEGLTLTMCYMYDIEDKHILGILSMMEYLHGSGDYDYEEVCIGKYIRDLKNNHMRVLRKKIKRKEVSSE